MDIERTRLLARDSTDWVNMKADTENIVKLHSIWHQFQEMQPKEKIIPMK